MLKEVKVATHTMMVLVEKTRPMPAGVLSNIPRLMELQKGKLNDQSKSLGSELCIRIQSLSLNRRHNRLISVSCSQRPPTAKLKNSASNLVSIDTRLKTELPLVAMVENEREQLPRGRIIIIMSGRHNGNYKGQIMERKLGMMLQDDPELHPGGDQKSILDNQRLILPKKYGISYFQSHWWQPYQNPTDNIMLPVETGELSIRIDTLSYELCIRIQSLPGNPQWSHDVTIVNPKLEELEISNIHSTIYTIGNSTMLVLNGICE